MKGELINMTQTCQMALLSMNSHSSVFGRSWVQFLSGTENFFLVPHLYHVDKVTFTVLTLTSQSWVSLEISLSIEYLLVFLDHK